MNETVVIVDDNHDFRSFARALLHREGFDVIGEAADGASGVGAVRRLRPDVVLLDVQLPDVDGFTVARSLREERAGSAVIITSTRDGADYGGAVAGCGAVGFVAKSEICGDALRELLDAAP